MAENVDLHIGGDPGTIAAEVLHEALGEVLALMKDAAQSLDAPAPQWLITDIHAASVHVGIADPVLNGPGVVVRDGLEALRTASLVPPRWSLDMVKRIRNLGRLTGRRGATSVSLSVAEDVVVIDGTITAHAEQALMASEVSWGSVVGRVERWNGGRGEIGVSLEGQSSVVVKYPPTLRDRVVHEAADRRIEAWGELHRNLAGQPVSLVLADFAVVDAPDLPVPVDQVAGSLAGILPDTVEEWIQENRGD